MKKLLLLTTLPLVAFLSSFAGNEQGPREYDATGTDTVVKAAGAPKGGFKDLFESQNADGSFFNVQLNPKAVSFVQDYMEVYSNKLNNMKSWGRTYFDLIDKVLAEHKLPSELKYLAVIESELKTSATSWVGAAGPWQLMPQTARELGLRVSKKNDERRDYTKSTHAAARYLNDLYNVFNDWLLVVAAYNGGPGNVNQAIRKSGSRNFWDLQYYLPTESRNHVKKFIATHYIMEGDGGVTTMTRNERADYAVQVSEPVAVAGVQSTVVSGKYNALVIAQNLGLDAATFNKLNPAFDKQLSEKGSYELRLPADKMQAFAEARNQILEQSVKALLMAAR
ncbi:lytic transglycosylase domain-containing protein [Flaviaesturariibacter aridisoli]|uniref:Lytic transglycosylase domain-containing protein n=1 Tax=Flaviaesturariibacter aridisoli TaxID=2545761 RepID=A0A4R4E488_9BACT|nr:lytic transglycosylase domain-containing protein [Flaviaesturariibacter aridisoli]TCZ73653.1 lytic transglycosylase domain-containing protein [Flaviaesturariibacter aridisoli]